MARRSSAADEISDGVNGENGWNWQDDAVQVEEESGLDAIAREAANVGWRK